MTISDMRQTLSLKFGRWECSLFLIVLGARLATFAYAGSPLPYYDQWLSEFNNTFLKISAGHELAALFTRHNEHVILTTKLLDLVGYLCNDYWDVPFLAICAAGVRALTVAWLFQFISDSIQTRTKTLLWLLCVLLFAIPFSGYNTLCGTQVSFYLVDFAMLWSLRTITHWTSPMRSGASLIGATLFGVLSLGSAIAIPVATLGAHLCFRSRKRPGFWLAWCASVAITAVYVLSILHAQADRPIGHLFSYLEMLQFWFQIISWPTNFATIGAVLAGTCVLGLVITSKRGLGVPSAQAILAGVALYAAANAALIAINRAPNELHMRHWDTIGLFALATLALGLHWTEQPILKRPAWLLLGLIGLIHAFSAGRLYLNVSQPYITAAHTSRAAAITHYRTLLLKQDFRADYEQTYAALVKKDYTFYDDPIGRYAIFPTAMNNIILLQNQQLRPLNLLSPDIIPGRAPSRFSQWTNALIAHGWLLIVGGGLLGFSAIRQAKPKS